MRKKIVYGKNFAEGDKQSNTRLKEQENSPEKRAREGNLDSNGSPIVARRRKATIGLSAKPELRAADPRGENAIRARGSFITSSLIYHGYPTTAIDQLPLDDVDVDELDELDELIPPPANNNALHIPIQAPTRLTNTPVQNVPQLPQAPASQVTDVLHQLPHTPAPQAADVPHQLPHAPAPQAADVIHQLPQAPAPQVADVLHFSSYLNRWAACPQFLEHATRKAHKKIFSLLHAEGGLFLCEDKRHVRYWGQNPSQEKTFIQPSSEPRRQIHLSTSAQDLALHSTWVSAIMKDANNQFYPIHIITRATLGTAERMVGYRQRIATLFPTPEFNSPWPHGLGQECLIIMVDTLDQKRQLVRDYSTLVTDLRVNRLETVPNFRVFFQNQLSKMYTPQQCRQQQIVGFLKPNITPYARKWMQLLEMEKAATDALRDRLTLEDFQRACNLFFQPALLSHELALTHFSFTQLNNFCGILTQSRIRMLKLKSDLYGAIEGAQIKDNDFQGFVALITPIIYQRTAIIDRLTELSTRYTNYSTRLSALFHLGKQPTIEAVENIIYSKIRDVMLEDHNVRIEDQFASGKHLIAWMLTQNIPVPEHNEQILVTDIADHLRAANPIFAGM